MPLGKGGSQNVVSRGSFSIQEDQGAQNSCTPPPLNILVLETACCWLLAGAQGPPTAPSNGVYLGILRCPTAPWP